MPRRSVAFLAFLIVAAACHPAAAPVTHAAPVAAPAPTTAPPSGFTEAPDGWQLMDDSADHVPGISAGKARRELLAGKTPKTIVVAVIDGGIDTAHKDLRPILWMRPANAPDDGHVGERFGWDFIGGPKGDVHYDTYQQTRLVVRCRNHTIPQQYATQCDSLTTDLSKRRAEAQAQLGRIREVSDAMNRAMAVLQRSLGSTPLNQDNVKALDPTDSATARSKQLYLVLMSRGGTPEAIADALSELQARLDYELNTDFDPRPIVGDDYADVHQSNYGNPDVMGPDAKHGSHVSGIIHSIDSSAVRVMMIRAVPDGDERDKDIANAIRFAVDHGARVINMSFGKGFSPEKFAVDDAVRYADAHNVLMVHAAGNDGKDLTSYPNFPTPAYADSGHARNWIEVGASSWQGGDTLAASFSNFGQTKVDVFAPGVDILSTVPGGYEKDSGTSMAAPVVTGLAALILSYHPDLSAADLKRVILESATRYTNQMVVAPGADNGQHVAFGTLSSTGGIVNAYNALKALER
jgi:subtilisin family serine protease